MILSTQNLLLGDLASETNPRTNSLTENCFRPEKLALFLVVFRASLGQKLVGWPISGVKRREILLMSPELILSAWF